MNLSDFYYNDLEDMATHLPDPNSKSALHSLGTTASLTDGQPLKNISA